MLQGDLLLLVLVLDLQTLLFLKRLLLGLLGLDLEPLGLLLHAGLFLSELGSFQERAGDVLAL
jgi:hypothetical protein